MTHSNLNMLVPSSGEFGTEYLRDENHSNNSMFDFAVIDKTISSSPIEPFRELVGMMSCPNVSAENLCRNRRCTHDSGPSIAAYLHNSKHPRDIINVR